MSGRVYTELEVRKIVFGACQELCDTGECDTVEGDIEEWLEAGESELYNYYITNPVDEAGV